MLFTNPNFWYDKPSLLLKLGLWPFSYIYSFFAHRRLRKSYEYKSSAKVIAVGGATVGGAGKTIVAKALASLFLERNKKVVFLSRGYARQSSDTRVVSEDDSYLDVGDEPLILSKVAPVIVGKNRAKSAKIAEKIGANIMILDDGFAQRYLKPDVNVLVVDSQQLFGNGYMLPLGPNRFDPHVLSSFVDFVIFLHSNNSGSERSDQIHQDHLDQGFVEKLMECLGQDLLDDVGGLRQGEGHGRMRVSETRNSQPETPADQELNRLSETLGEGEKAARSGGGCLQDHPELSHFKGIPVIDAALVVSLNASKRIVPFCGLGYPKKFFKSLSEHEIVETFTFPDHYPYTDEDIVKLINFAYENNADLVTTEKDLARIPRKYHLRIKKASVILHA